jgi:hypothetical protein
MTMPVAGTHRAARAAVGGGPAAAGRECPSARRRGAPLTIAVEVSPQGLTTGAYTGELVFQSGAAW